MQTTSWHNTISKSVQYDIDIDIIVEFHLFIFLYISESDIELLCLNHAFFEYGFAYLWWEGNVLQ